MTKRQRDIVDAAIWIIANRGYSEFTTRNLAQRIGITEAALYRHIKSKSTVLDMILDCFQSYAAETIETIEKKDDAPLKSIKAFVFDRYDLFTQNPDLAKVMFSDEMFFHNPCLSERYLTIMHIHREFLLKMLKLGQQRGEIRWDLNLLSIFRTVIGSMRLLTAQWQLSGKGFDLKKEGKKLWKDIEKMIKET